MFLNSETYILQIGSILAIAVNLILALLVFVNDRKNDTNIIFGFLNIALSFYLAANLFSVTEISHGDKLFWIRMTLYAAVFLDTLFYLFIRVFPGKELAMSFSARSVVIISTAITAFITLTPWVFSDITLSEGTSVPTPIVESGMAIFVIVAVSYVGAGIVLIIKKYREEIDSLVKKQLGLIMAGTGVMFFSFLFFNLFLTVFLNNVYFIKLTPLFTTVFVIFSAYAILRLKMFNVKVIATELLVFSLWFFILVRTLFSITYEDQLINGSLLFLLVITGVFLIRSVLKEVEQREKILEGARALKESNAREMEKARSVAKLKDEFVFIATHELRTPITAIRGFLELVSEAEGSFPADVQSDLDAIKMASEHLNELVNSILEIARSDSGAMKVETKPVDLAPIIKQILEEVSSLVIEKAASVKVHDLRGGIMVLADEKKTKEVLVNLIGNAVKYNRKGGIVEINILCCDAKDVIVEIRDNGFGIPKDQQEKIFGKFFRASNKDTQGIMGTGLGLFITRMLMEKMGGSIKFSSVEGKGTTFAVSWPRA